MVDCKSAERKHNWLGSAENWQLTLSLPWFSLVGEMHMSVRECHSCSDVIINDNHSSICRKGLYVGHAIKHSFGQTTVGYFSHDGLKLEEEGKKRIWIVWVSKQNLIILFQRKSRRNVRVFKSFYKQTELPIHLWTVSSHMKRNQNTGQMLSKTTFKTCHKLAFFFQMIGARLLNKAQLEWILHGRGMRKYLSSQL